jgi:hypothetical protein
MRNGMLFFTEIHWEQNKMVNFYTTCVEVTYTTSLQLAAK